MKSLLGFICTVLLLAVLVLINGAQTLSLAIKPFAPETFRRFNRWVAGAWWGWCALGAEKGHGVEIVLTGDTLPVGENSIIVLNHQGMTDIPALFSIAKAKERLGDLKWFVKDALKYVPGMGWGMLFLDCLFIKRDWLSDQKHIHAVFEKILKHSVPLWLVSFVEGTRLTPAKLLQSQEYARQQRLPAPRHVLIPRTKGFVASVQSLRGHVDAVYDLTIGYVNGAPSLSDWIHGKVSSVHLNIRRFPIDSLPREGQALSQWLLQLFQEKDELLDTFYQEGVFSVPA